MVLTILDLLLPLVYFILIYFVSGYVQVKNKIKGKFYRWYRTGLLVKIVGAIAVCLIYQFYYKGGDTSNYYVTTKALSHLLFNDSSSFFKIIRGDHSWEMYSVFNQSTGYPIYWKDTTALFISKLFIPLYFVSFGSFIVMAMLLAWICYSGIWRLFMLFNSHFKQLEKQFAIAFLFIPSVVFWGSGLLKDSITISAVGWYTYHFYYFFIEKRYSFKSGIFILISAMLLVLIKPYILFALLPGSIIWFSNEKLDTIKNRLTRTIVAPLFIIIGAIVSFFLLSQIDGLLGNYSLDNVLDQAVIANLDQKQEYYQGNSFDIGEFDADPLSMLSKAHLAIAATLFRPYLWDVKNVVMLVSALENTYILLLTLFLIIKLKVLNFFILIGKNPLILFSVLFSLFFAFSVGIATSNFGSLVRLKIPCIPFYVASLFILKYFYDIKIDRIKLKQKLKNKEKRLIPIVDSRV